MLRVHADQPQKCVNNAELEAGDSFEEYAIVLDRLASTATLVARYNVVGNIFCNWLGINFDEAYQETLISLAQNVLAFLKYLLTMMIRILGSLWSIGTTFTMPILFIEVSMSRF